MGAVLAFLLFPLVESIESLGLKRPYALLILYILVFGLLAAVFWTVIPNLGREMTELAELMPGYLENAKSAMDSLDGLQFGEELKSILKHSVEETEKRAYVAMSDFTGDIIGLAGSLLSIVFTPILAYYFIMDWEKIRDGFLSFLPPDYRRKTAALGREIDRVLSGFVQGHLTVCLLVGGMTGLAAALLGIEYAIIIGFIAGLAELFPYVGPFLGAVPALGLAAGNSLYKALYLGAAILVIQQVESNVISPRIVGKKVGLHPLAVIFALLAGGELFGLWGIIIAVPAAAVLKILVRFAFYQVVD
jgi:predicted PurR-regulated permease PerM